MRATWSSFIQDYIPIIPDFSFLTYSLISQDGRLQIGDHILQVNSIKCTNLGQSETKEIIIPELRRSTPTVKLLVQHASKRLRTPSSNAPSSTGSTPSKSGPGSTLPVQKHADQVGPLYIRPPGLFFNFSSFTGTRFVAPWSSVVILTPGLAHSLPVWDGHPPGPSLDQVEPRETLRYLDETS